jgi:alkylation response protein AidB-like acyl-CoA dehydrogenase
VPVERTAGALHDPPNVDSPWTRIPIPASIALAMAPVPLGIARGALGDVVELTGSKVPLLGSSATAADPVFEHQLAEADAQLRAARAGLLEVAEKAWSMAVAGDEFTPLDRAHLRATAVHAATTARSVVELAYRWGGGSSLYLESPLQRRLRDVHAVNQHFLLRPAATLITCGAVLAGQNPELTIF